MQIDNSIHNDKASKLEVIYLGIDVHVNKWVVVAQEDGLTPKPAVSFKDELKLLNWLGKQQKRANQLVACYEAGPTGYHLQRTLTAMNIKCHVVAAKKWSENEDRVKTDKRDAKILCQRLELYERGNRSILKVLRVPSIEEENQRRKTRRRKILNRDLQRQAQRGRGLGTTQGISMKGTWWKGGKWKELQSEITSEMLEELSSIKRIIEVMENEEKQLIATIEEEENQSGTPRPKWLGALSFACIKAEVCDFGRFNNRRQVSSYTGLCPSEYSSGGKRLQGHINKHGNPALRSYLVEATWRLVVRQPNWHVYKKYEHQFLQAKSGRKKQLVIAMARQLAIDLWRLSTGQTTLETLGLEPA